MMKLKAYCSVCTLLAGLFFLSGFTGCDDPDFLVAQGLNKVQGKPFAVGEIVDAIKNLV